MKKNQMIIGALLSAFIIFNPALSAQGTPKPSAQYYFTKGITSYKDKNYTQSLKLMSQAVKINPKLQQGHYYIGLLNYNQRNYADALSSFTKAFSLSPKDSQSAYMEGMCYTYLGSPQNAVECYDIAIKLKPSLSQAYDDKAIALGTLGKFKDALESVDKAISLGLNTPLVHIDRGEILEAMKNYSEAEKSYLKALSINSGNSLLLYDLSSFYLTQNNYENALKYGSLYIDSKDAEKAYSIKTQDSTVKVDPAKDRTARTYYNMAYASYKLESFDKADKYADECLKTSPDIIEAKLIKADIRKQTGDLTNAESLYKEVLQSANNAYVYYQLACTLALEGKNADAADALWSVFALDSSYADKAKTEKAFDSIRNSKEYSEITANQLSEISKDFKDYAVLYDEYLSKTSFKKAASSDYKDLSVQVQNIISDYYTSIIDGSVTDKASAEKTVSPSSPFLDEIINYGSDYNAQLKQGVKYTYSLLNQELYAVGTKNGDVTTAILKVEESISVQDKAPSKVSEYIVLVKENGSWKFFSSLTPANN